MPSPPAPSPPRVLVLGAGLAGLVAAREAARSGAEVTVLEKETRPGGMARCVHFGDITADLGPHRVYSTMPEMRRWFRRELGERLFRVTRRSRMFVRGRFVPYPPSPLDMLRAFGPADMTRFAAGWATARLRGALGARPEASFADVMVHTYGRPLCEEMVFPYIRKLWRCEADEISADAARARATMGGVGRLLKRWLGRREAEGRESSLKTFEYVRGGMETLVTQLADEVRRAGGRIVCRADVREIVCGKGRAQSVRWSESGENRELDCDFVFSTIPLESLAEALSGAANLDRARAAVQRLASLDCLLVYLDIGRPNIGPETWFYFPQALPSLNRAYQPKMFDDTLVPPERSVLCVEATAPPEDALWQRGQEDLALDFTKRAASTGLLSVEEVRAVHARRLRHAYPVYRRGYRVLREEVFGTLRGIENLISLGRQGLFQHNNMDHTIWTALRAETCRRAEKAPVATWFDREVPSFEDFRIVD